MKRSHVEEDGHVPKKKRRCEIVTPFSNVVDLAYLYGLKMFVFDQQPFCFCMYRGIAVLDAQCTYCPSHSDFNNHGCEKRAMESFKSVRNEEEDNYIAYALITELFHRGEAIHIDVCRVGENIQLHVKDVRHLSPFCIHLLLMKDFVEDIRINLLTREMFVVCKRGGKTMDMQSISSDSILNNELTRMKRNILTLTRHTELKKFL